MVCQMLNISIWHTDANAVYGVILLREEIKAGKEKKERDFNVNVNNVSVKVRVILFNERG